MIMLKKQYGSLPLIVTMAIFLAGCGSDKILEDSCYLEYFYALKTPSETRQSKNQKVTFEAPLSLACIDTLNGSSGGLNLRLSIQGPALPGGFVENMKFGPNRKIVFDINEPDQLLALSSGSVEFSRVFNASYEDINLSQWLLPWHVDYQRRPTKSPRTTAADTSSKQLYSDITYSIGLVLPDDINTADYPQDINVILMPAP